MFESDSISHDVAYDRPGDTSHRSTSVSVFSNSFAVRQEIVADLSAAGICAFDDGAIARQIDESRVARGEVVVVDCPGVDGQCLSVLARLDMQAARAGTRLIVSTSFDSLDAVFGVLDQCDPQILVQPSRGERIVAVGRVLAEIGDNRLRELRDEDRVRLLHLSRQVEEIASKLDQLSHNREPLSEGKAERLADSASGFNGSAPNPLLNYKHRDEACEVSAPDPCLVRKVIASRQARARFFDADLFADPAWDMLLDLTAAEGDGKRVSVTSLCIAAAVPATTALRWIKQLVDCGIFERVDDPDDKRRAFIGLSPRSRRAMARYFAEVEIPLAQAA